MTPNPQFPGLNGDVYWKPFFFFFFKVLAPLKQLLTYSVVAEEAADCGKDRSGSAPSPESR